MNNFALEIDTLRIAHMGTKGDLFDLPGDLQSKVFFEVQFIDEIVFNQIMSKYQWQALERSETDLGSVVPDISFLKYSKLLSSELIRSDLFGKVIADDSNLILYFEISSGI